MKIVTYLLGALLAAALGAAALFYFMTFQPMAADYARMKAGLPEQDKAKAELKKYRDRETQQARENSWITPAMEALSNGLADEVKSGKAEVVSAGNMVVVNIAEAALYTPESKTFAKDTQTRLKLSSLLKKDEFKGRDIFVGNVTDAVAAHGKGKKRVPAKDALTLSSERSAEMLKYLIKDGVSSDSIAALAYPGKVPDRGYAIKNKKTMIVIGTCPAAAVQKQAAAPAAQPKSAPSGTHASPVAPQPLQKAIPLKQAQPKGN